MKNIERYTGQWKIIPHLSKNGRLNASYSIIENEKQELECDYKWNDQHGKRKQFSFRFTLNQPPRQEHVDRGDVILHKGGFKPDGTLFYSMYQYESQPIIEITLQINETGMMKVVQKRWGFPEGFYENIEYYKKI